MTLSANLAKLCLKTLQPWSPQVTPVRYRYHAEKIAKGPLVRRYGYEDGLERRGLLPRPKDASKLPMPTYIPKDAWKEKRALFGQNDYIDILGNENMHPSRLLYNVPGWLRGVGGTEYHMMLRKRRMLGQTVFPLARPTKWYQLQKRIHYLYRFLNRKTRTNFSKQ